MVIPTSGRWVVITSLPFRQKQEKLILDFRMKQKHHPGNSERHMKISKIILKKVEICRKNQKK